MTVQNQRLPKDKITATATTTLFSSPPPPSAATLASSTSSTATTSATSMPPVNSSFPVAAANLSSSSKVFQTPAMAISTPAHQASQTPPPLPPSQSVTSAAAATAASLNIPNGGSGNGPRVSFNRDVHVKRIGKRSNDLTNYELKNLQPPQQHYHHPHHHHHHHHTAAPSYHHLPADLSAESIQKEAALVLAQAKRHKSTAENADNIPTFKVKHKRSGDSNPQKFNSLPLRKKKPPTKPLTRSSSDAAAKKPSKRPSIFSIFSRKSDSNLNQVERDPRFEDSGGRRLVRSKSDVGSSTYKLKKVLKDSKNSQPLQLSSKSHLPSQLSPIIENDSKEDCFEEQFSNRERRKSEAITDREKHESAISELLSRSRNQAEIDGSLVGRRAPISKGIREKILNLQAKSQENMHSSQLPPQKLPLTKGHTVNGMVKRLSMERFSPPPAMSGAAFSYIRPNDGITYAQLELQEDNPQRNVLNTMQRRDFLNRSPIREYNQSPIASREREYTRSPIREYRSPTREFRSSSRDIFTPERELLSTTKLLNRKTEDQTDFVASQRNTYSPNYNTQNGTTTIHIGGSFSPSPWQQLSPRNLSDEDEGLGLETRKYYDEDAQLKRSKSPAEPPIVPKIRSITPPPRENGFHNTAPHERYHTPSRDININDDMGYRRARLESRILTRRFGDSAAAANGAHRSRENSHERVLESRESPSYLHRRYLSPEREVARDNYEPRFHKLEAREIINKYSPERSHLDIIAPSTSTTGINITNSNVTPTPMSTMEKTSRYKHTKYYDDGHGGVKEVYERETQFDNDGKPHVKESRHRERLDSYTGKPIREEGSPLMERQLLTDYEPKSLDSQLTSTDQYRSSPENMKRYDISSDRMGEDRWHSSLKRDKLQQRSFDKGDSGIENDFRKESFNGDLVTRWRKRTPIDDIKASENFLKKERRHCEQERHMPESRHVIDNYVYRERSIDDGSHYDPHLDKYPLRGSSSTLRQRDQQSQTLQDPREATSTSTLKRNKKLGGFEKVKQLFSGGGSSGGAGGDKKDPERKSVSSSTSSSAGTQQTIKSKDKDKYMAKEEEMHLRYRGEHHRMANGGGGGSSSISSGGGVGVGTQTHSEPKAIDISMRRRLSTPKASPLLLKRTSSDNKTSKESPLAKPEKLSWFKSLDRRSKSKSKENLNAPSSDTSSLKRTKNYRQTTTTQTQPTKNLRFFGDTDLDSNPPTISKANSLQKSRPLASTSLNRSQKYSQSAYNLDRIRSDSPQRQDYRHSLATGSKSLGFGPSANTTTTTTTTTTTQRHRSTSMQNLDNQGNDEVDYRRRRHYSRSRELDHISESGSETEDQQQQKTRPGLMASRTLSRDRLDRTQRYDDHSYRRSTDRPLSSTPNGGETSSSTQHQARRSQPYLMGPPKPARSNERRAMSYSRDRDRFPAESSGTEGESSLHSQRSIVYLHATTVGAIPQPYHLRRRAISRDDLSSNKSSKQQNQPLQPMTRTVSRSVSMLAPWKPKLISDGYEINYSQEQNKTMSTLPRKNLQNGKTNSMARPPKKPDSSRHTNPRRHTEYLKDDQSSLRNSSTTSASKSGLSTNLHRKLK